MGARCAILLSVVACIGCGARETEAETASAAPEVVAEAQVDPPALAADVHVEAEDDRLPLLRGRIDGERLVLTEGPVEALLPEERVVGALQVVPLTVDGSRRAVFEVRSRPTLLAELTEAGEVRVLWRRDPTRAWYLTVRLVDLDGDGTHELIEQWVTPRRPHQGDHGGGGGDHRPRVLRLGQGGYEESASLRARAPDRRFPFVDGDALVRDLWPAARVQRRSDVASSRTVTGIRPRSGGVEMIGGTHGPGDVQVGDVVAYLVSVPGEQGPLLGEARLVVARGDSVLDSATLGTRDMRGSGEGCASNFTGGPAVLAQDWDMDGTRAIVAIWNASREGTVARAVRWDGERLGPMLEPVAFESCEHAGTAPPRVSLTPARSDDEEPEINIAP